MGSFHDGSLHSISGFYFNSFRLIACLADDDGDISDREAAHFMDAMQKVRANQGRERGGFDGCIPL